MALAETIARMPKGGDMLGELSRRAKDTGAPGRDDVYGFGVIDRGDDQLEAMKTAK